MKAFFALLRVNFKSILLTTAGLGRGKKNRAKAATGFAPLLLISLVLLYLSGTYSFLLGSTFAQEGALDIMLGMMILMATFWPLFFIIFGAQGLIFSAKDSDFVFSLPLPAFTVMLSRVFALYLEALLLCQLMLVPAGISYIYNGGENGAKTFILLLISGFFMAFIPCLISLLFGAIVAFLVSRLPFKNILTVVFSLLLMAGVLLSSLAITTTTQVSSVDGLRNMLKSIPLFGWALQGVQGGLLPLFLFAVFSCAPFFFVVWVFSFFYKRLLTNLSSHHLRSNYKVGKLKVRGAGFALFTKEIKRFLSSPSYMLNSGSGVIMTLLACVFALINKDNATQLLASFAQGVFGLSTLNEVYSFLSPLILLFICFVGGVNYCSAASISLEGKCLWLLKCAPVSTANIFAAKVGFNLMLSGFCCTLASLSFGYTFSLPFLHVGIILTLSLLFCLLISLLGLYINLVFPRLDAENDTVIVKQSASVLLTLFASIVVLGFFFFVYYLMKNPQFTVFSLVCAGILLLLNALLLALLNTNGKKRFLALY